MKDKKNVKTSRRFTALAYDIPMLVFSVFFFLYLNPSVDTHTRLKYVFFQLALCALCVFTARLIAGVYKQILRYGGSRMYISLILADFCAGVVYYLIQLLIPAGPIRVTFIRAVCIISLNLLMAVSGRLIYQYVFEFGSRKLWTYPVFRGAVKLMTGLHLEDPALKEEGKNLAPEGKESSSAPKTYHDRKKLAIVGAGRIGAMLAKELLTNQNSAYFPACFVMSENI